MRLILLKKVAFLAPRKVLGIFYLCTACLFLNGCAVGWVYHQLDWLIPWYVRDYLDLDSSQKKWLDARVLYHLEWHKRTQLPQYAEFLNNIAGHLRSRSLTESDVRQFYTEAERLGRQLVVEITPDVIELFRRASDSQVEKLLRKIDQDNTDFNKTYVESSGKTQRELQLKEMQRFAKKWLGGISSEQKDIFQKWSENWQPLYSDLYAQQLRWRNEFNKCLSLRASPQFEGCIAALLEHGNNLQNEGYRQKYNFNLSLTGKLWVDIHQTLTEKQRKHAIEQVDALADECVALAAEVKK